MAATVTLIGCGGDDGGAATGRGGGESAQRAPGPQISLPGGPAQALQANARQANQIVGEGVQDMKTRLADLRGYPVVVNQWGSWCPPCRAEFPYFAQMVTKYGDRVAFLGLDAADQRGAAEDFLREVPPGFPNIFDPDGKATRELGGGRGSPSTFFIDASGERVDLRIGAYPDVDALERDIREVLAGG